MTQQNKCVETLTKISSVTELKRQEKKDLSVYSKSAVYEINQMEIESYY